MALNIDRITKLSEQIIQGTKLIAQGNEKDRVNLVATAFKLGHALETPKEYLIKLTLLDVCDTNLRGDDVYTPNAYYSSFRPSQELLSRLPPT